VGVSLHTRLLLGIPEQKRQQKIFEDFSASLQDQAFVPKWTKMVEEWEKDPSKSNPYMSVVATASQDDVKRQLLLEEKESLKAGIPQIHDTGPTSFITMGLLVEDSQRRIAWDARAKEELTLSQSNDIHRRRLLLHRQLKQFRNLQAVYMPAASLMIAQYDEAQKALPVEERARDEVEYHILWLPSALPDDHMLHNCRANLVAIETKLRQAQCYDTLEKIRSLQRGRLSFIGFRNRNIRGQNPNTRASETIARVEMKCMALAVKYREARAALFKLIGPGAWENELRELSHKDLTTPDGTEISIEDPNDVIGPDGRQVSKKKRLIIERRLGEGYRSVSWIWMRAPATGDESDAVLHESVRIEWAKARARYLRWSEEVQLLKEEMRRVRKTLEWEA
ncbi:hypothetical protein K443DRAFT_55668, partial [Laccaria amethystina LaAM-08-1]